MSKTTMQELADDMGISRVTVWKALRNKPGVSDSLRKKIFDKARSLGYTIGNENFLSEANSHTPIISVVVSRPESSAFWMQIIHQIAKEFSEQNINLMYTYLPPSFGKDTSLPTCLLDGSVEGVIVLNIYDALALHALSELPLPKVFLDTVPTISPYMLNGDLILLEGRDRVREITNRIIQKGYRQIGFIGDIAYAQTNTDRYQGFVDAMQDNGFPIDPQYCMTDALSLNSHYEEICTFLSNLKKLPEVFVCASDFIAHYVQRYLSEKGLLLGKDIILTGFDNSSEYGNVAGLITSVDVQTSTLGQRLAQKLLFRLKYPTASYEVSYIASNIIYRAPLSNI